MNLADMTEFLAKVEDHADTIVGKLAELDADFNTLGELLGSLFETNNDWLKDGIAEFCKAETGVTEAYQQIYYLKECVEGYAAGL